MVSGGVDSELQSLTACFQSVAQDLKTSNSSIELVCNKAVKLANQLNLTMSCLVGFSDAIQVISDAASKWSSRDIGTTLTRFCIRQRALETEMKVLATSLIDNFARPLEKKGVEWKQTLSDIERRHQKNLKKTRSKKQSLAKDLVDEHKTGCAELLLEQRSQFSTFATLLLPLINAQLRMFEEGLHLKAVKENIEQSVATNNAEAIINTVIEDVCSNNWRKRIGSPTRNQQIVKNRSSCNDSSSSPSTSSIALNDNSSLYFGTVSSASSSRPQTLSNSVDFGKRAALSAHTFVPPAGTPFVQNSPSEFAKPPLPHRSNNGSVYGNQTPLSNNTFSVSSNDVSDPDMHQPRPLSSNGDNGQLDEDKQNETLSARISHLVDQFNDEIHSMCDQSLPQALTDNGMNTVRRLGSEPANIPASISMTQRLSVDAIRRPESIRPPPPPPERRNSTITAATPTAPSIFDLRNAGVFGRSNPLNGRVRSIQNLNQYDQEAAYNTGGVVYRTPFSNLADTTDYSDPQSDTLPEPPPNSGRSSSYQQPQMGYRPQPPAYNNYDTQF